MPQIKPYNVQTSAGNVPDVRVASNASFEATGEAVQRLGDAVSQTGQILQRRKEQQEISDIHVKMSQAQSDFTQEFQDQLQKGTLNTEEFSKNLSDHTDELSDEVGTRAGRLYFNQASAALKAHFLDKVAVGQAEIAGKTAVNNYTKTLNNNSSTLINDPSSFEMIRDAQAEGIKNLVATGGLPAEAAGKLQTQGEVELGKSALRGWIKLNPQDAKDQLDSGKWDKYFDGDVKHQLYGEIKTAESAERAEDARLKTLQKEALQAEQMKTQNSFLSKLEKNELTTKEVLESNLDPSGVGGKEHYIKMIDQHNQDRKFHSDPGVFNDLTQKLVLPDGDPNKITDQNEILKHLGKDISITDGNLLLGLLAEKHTPQGEADAAAQRNAMETVKNRLIKNPLLPDPKGMELWRDTSAQMLQYSLEAARNGKTKQQIWAPIIGGKPNPDFVGNHVHAPERSLEDIVNSMADSMTGPHGEEMVKVINPQGVTGRIPKSKLADKLKNGYREVGK